MQYCDFAVVYCIFCIFLLYRSCVIIRDIQDTLERNTPEMTKNLINSELYSVSDIFHILLTEIEKADGNMSEKSNCSVC
ncbi:hypothetical protein NQ314_017197 [Rhamnusium bicolor]|uniref:Uncharacterized protein n=1 Tax=Rhamnusium bicolor TaxID=1586634 RepID=A0AAV8WTW0_9CUCU|nr:hypothetical protein NQ314_017197 [Rhamnusium bicolor]